MAKKAQKKSNKKAQKAPVMDSVKKNWCIDRFIDSFICGTKKGCNRCSVPEKWRG